MGVVIRRGGGFEFPGTFLPSRFLGLQLGRRERRRPYSIFLPAEDLAKMTWLGHTLSQLAYP
jgi:hypothetical protein